MAWDGTVTKRLFDVYDSKKPTRPKDAAKEAVALGFKHSSATTVFHLWRQLRALGIEGVPDKSQSIVRELAREAPSRAPAMEKPPRVDDDVAAMRACPNYENCSASVCPLDPNWCWRRPKTEPLLRVVPIEN